MDENVNRFCNLVVKINQLSKNLKEEKKDYDNGHPRRAHMYDNFEKLWLYEHDISELEALQEEFKSCLINFYFISPRLKEDVENQKLD